MSRGSCLSRLFEPELHQRSSLAALLPDLSPIEQLWDELVIRVRHVKIHRKRYLSCVTHLCTTETTSHKPLCTDWIYALEKLSLLQEVVTHVIEISKLPYCTTIYVCP
jgi:hypothetical protein